ncbi:hypothetical protein TNCV_2662701 [Trichonephila clavipes]|nr:hypothetical protein TNCV_2662701 [Trichonephila clavipes]
MLLQADVMSNRWFFRRQTKDQHRMTSSPPKWVVDNTACNSSNVDKKARERCLPSLPKIELTASSPTAGHVPPLSPVRNLGVPSLVLQTADSLDNIAPHIPSFALGDSTAYQLPHRSINPKVANRVAKNDVNLALSPTFRYVSIELLL